MKRNQTSTTAEGIALMRMIESAKPEDERVVYDPYAQVFVNPFLKVLAKIFSSPAAMERRGKGVVGFLAARERHIDEFTRQCLDEGIRQVVILGAGYDSRALRIPGMQQARVFEVDLPATQAVKQQKLEKHLGQLPAHVTYVPVDFNTQSLGKQLGAAGYDQHQQTLFIWQGVVYYITQQAVDATLKFIATRSAPGSALIFDYASPSYLKDTQHGEIKRMKAMQKMTGESLSTGIPHEQIEPYLRERGFTDIHNATADDFKRLYFHGKNAGRAITPGYAIVTARVARRE